MWRQAVHYRNRAELLRSIAKETNHEAHKQALRNVAGYYDALADRLEQEAKSQMKDEAG